MAASSIAGGEPRLAGLMVRRAHIHLQQHLQNGQIDELDQAMAAVQIAVHLAKSGPKRVHLGSMLNMLGILSLRRYARNANEAVLDDALHQFSWALEYFSDSHPQQAIALAGIAQMRASRYDRTGAMLDLEEAVSQMQTAIHIQQRFNDTDLLAIMLSNLGCVLWRRYQRTGNSENLHEAFTSMTKAVAAVSPDNAQLRGSIWTNLAGLLVRQYEVTHALEHLGNAVFEAREVAHAAPESPELDLLLDFLGKLARREHARRVSVPGRATPPFLSFYSELLVLSIVVSLFVVFSSYSKMLFYPIVFLVGMCCSGITSKLYQKYTEGNRQSQSLYFTRAESPNTPLEDIPKILDLPLFDDRLFETIQTESDNYAFGVDGPSNFVQTNDYAITEREDVHGNNEDEYYAESTRSALNKSSDPSFHDREADQVPQIENEKQNPIIAVSKLQPRDNTPNDEGFSGSVESDRSRNETENDKLPFADVKSDQKKQAQILNTAPTHVNIKQASEEETTKIVADPSAEQAQDRVQNVNVTGRLSIDPSSYIASEQLRNRRPPSSSPSMRPAGGDAQSTLNTESIPHAPTALRNVRKKQIHKKFRNFDLPNLMSQQNAQKESENLVAADQGDTTHDIHKNEGNAMGNLFSRRANVVGG
ncbi:hypothetical protein BDW42DRAFT_177055 [Aspergillus taichungensis]|uniref:Uncharacterized protein n=1 Tax=Aspergillus taichungensis TaxID=482145 RepID=A0A2J5HJU2_9EURO|nr:hypothetical protein BDW42DRAFT_177055 [Aspergillus taichungensis]